MLEIKENCRRLLAECQNSMRLNEVGVVKDQRSQPKSSEKAQSTIAVSTMSRQEHQQNNRTIEKMRKKGIKRNRDVFIKKTSLGQDQLTFTKQQYTTLQMIDQCQQEGLTYYQPTQLDKFDNLEKMSAVDRLRQLAKVGDINDEIKGNLEWMNLKENQGKVESKVVGKGIFVKYSHGNFNNPMFSLHKQSSEDYSKNTKLSLNKYYVTLLNKKSFRKSFFVSVSSWQDKTLTYNARFQQKIDKIKDKAQRYIEAKCSSNSSFMTEGRRNALYECQLLRLAKKMLTQKQYQKLSLCSWDKANQDEQLQQAYFHKQKKPDFEEKYRQAEEVLAKNYERIKVEKKRVIQKLLC